MSRAPPGGLRGAAEGRAAPAGRYARRRAGNRRPQRGRKCWVKSEGPSWKGAGGSGTAIPQDGGRRRRRRRRGGAVVARGLMGRPARLPRQRGFPAAPLSRPDPAGGPAARPGVGPGPAQPTSPQPGLGQARPSALPWPDPAACPWPGLPRRPAPQGRLPSAEEPQAEGLPGRGPSSRFDRAERDRLPPFAAVAEEDSASDSSRSHPASPERPSCPGRCCVAHIATCLRSTLAVWAPLPVRSLSVKRGTSALALLGRNLCPLSWPRLEAVKPKAAGSPGLMRAHPQLEEQLGTTASSSTSRCRFPTRSSWCTQESVALQPLLPGDEEGTPAPRRGSWQA
ncbi:uncharacterized protein LOC142362799 [Opisthocomus hoazin]|uniref:uncharacterized protein LOC142362799 n=1 Tax=Opisthocomus hoazin TaxID=30419 RepID=UPI003F53DB80